MMGAGNGGSGISREGLLDVVVFSRGQRSVALVVGEILEIVNDRGAERRPADSYGLEQLVVLAGKVTELVDLPLVLQTGDPEYFNDVVVEPDGASLLEARTVNA